MTRRELLAAALAVPAGEHDRPRLAVQAYVWEQSLFLGKRSLADGVADAVRSMADAGFRTVEMTSTFFTPDLAERTLDLLDAHSLKLAVVYNGGAMHDPAAAARTAEDTLAVADRVKRARIEAISFNASPKKARERKTGSELEIQTRAIGDLGKKLRSTGLRLLLHEHAPELAENAREWRHTLRGTRAEDVSICLDVDWVLRGGLQPMTLLQESMPRLGSLHLRNSRMGVWLEELAEGDIDYREIAAHLRKHRWSGLLVVELAWEKQTRITRSLTENLRRSRRYAEQVFGVRA